MAGILIAPETNTVEIVPVVFVSVEVDSTTNTRLGLWMLENHIYGLRGYGYMDPYHTTGFYKAEDAERIRAWCEKHGVTLS